MAVTGTLTGTGPSDSYRVKGTPPFLSISVWGTFVGTLQIERSYNSGTNWLPLTALGNEIDFEAPFTENFEEHETGTEYRLNCTAYTSGTINYRLGQ